MDENSDAHPQETRKLLVFGALFLGLTASSYALPQAESVRPWLPGEPLPLVHLVTDGVVVRETATGGLERVAAVVEAPPEAVASSYLAPAPAAPLDPALIEASTLPVHEPAVPAALVFKPGALDPFWTALAAAEAKEPGRIVRVLHWGDSTIAADGLSGTVRQRLVARFGDGGPGFLAVHVDPMWNTRPGVVRAPEGEWQSHSITFGGIETSRYGLSGIVSTATTEAGSLLGGGKLAGQRQAIARFDVFYQVQPGGGTLSIKPRGSGGAVVSTASEKFGDRYRELSVPAGSPSVWIGAGGDGPVTVYGVALETAGPGITWENFGVAGSSIGSLTRQSRAHLAGQVAHRAPDLLVYMTGGNEVGYPSLKAGAGEAYRDAYRIALQKLRIGAPEAACLVISPLDQATRERGKIISKPMLAKLIGVQQQVALEEGCAFWNAQAAMGGDGGFVRFLEHTPKLAWTDLVHLTNDGLDAVGNGLADAILASYDGWRAARSKESPDM